MESLTFFLGVIIFATLYQMQRRQAGAERKLNALLRHFNIEAALGLVLSDKVKKLARDPAQKAKAIKVHQSETGTELAEATEAVEAYINSCLTSVAGNEFRR